jgi:hypothetical protein
MHSHDKNKDADLFLREFNLTLSRATPTGVADFSDFVFPADFFPPKEFLVRSEFESAVFLGDVSFFKVIFQQGAGFNFVHFEAHADFDRCVFNGPASFDHAWFAMSMSFKSCMFRQSAHFNHAHFPAFVDFSHTQFLDAVEFRETSFAGAHKVGQYDPNLPGPVFSRASFAKPELVVFYKCYLGQALFCNCDVSRFMFSNITWRSRPRNGKKMVFEEDVTLNAAANDLPDGGICVFPLRPRGKQADERNYDLIAELYQQLKKNYDDRCDYRTAGDFHYGEMEMLRKGVPTHLWFVTQNLRMGFGGPYLMRLRRGWHRTFGLAAWYKRFSEYGESAGRPLIWLLVFVALFTLIYPALGLRCVPSKDLARPASPRGMTERADEVVLSYWKRCPDSSTYRTCMSSLRLLGNSAVTTLQVAALQKDLVYEPMYPWGRVLALFEALLSSTVITLFLLALRRRFKR